MSLTQTNMDIPIIKYTSVFLYIVLSLRYFLIVHNCITQAVSSATSVPMTAPIAPYFGINVQLIIKFTAAPMTTDRIKIISNLYGIKYCVLADIENPLITRTGDNAIINKTHSSYPVPKKTGVNSFAIADIPNAIATLNAITNSRDSRNNLSPSFFLPADSQRKS